MTTKLDKCAKRINDDFASKLQEAFLKKFNRRLTTTLNFVHLRIMSFPSDGKPFTKEQQQWVQAYETGYCEALNAIRSMANGC